MAVAVACSSTSISPTTSRSCSSGALVHSSGGRSRRRSPWIDPDRARAPGTTAPPASRHPPRARRRPAARGPRCTTVCRGPDVAGPPLVGARHPVPDRLGRRGSRCPGPSASGRTRRAPRRAGSPTARSGRTRRACRPGHRGCPSSAVQCRERRRAGAAARSASRSRDRSGTSTRSSSGRRSRSSHHSSRSGCSTAIARHRSSHGCGSWWSLSAAWSTVIDDSPFMVANLRCSGGECRTARAAVDQLAAPELVAPAGGEPDHGQERRHEPGAEQAVVDCRLVEVGGDRHREDRPQVRRPLDGRLELGHGEVADADHPDVAVAPRLRGRPLDEVVAGRGVPARRRSRTSRPTRRSRAGWR